MPEDKEYVLQSIENRGVSEQRKYDAIAKNNKIKLEIDEDIKIKLDSIKIVEIK